MDTASTMTRVAKENRLDHPPYGRRNWNIRFREEGSLRRNNLAVLFSIFDRDHQHGRQHGKGYQYADGNADGSDNTQFRNALEISEGKGKKSCGNCRRSHDNRPDIPVQGRPQTFEALAPLAQLFLVAQYNLDPVLDADADQHNGKDHRENIEMTDHQGRHPEGEGNRNQRWRCPGPAACPRSGWACS